MVTMIHCETPSGTLNPLGAIGQLCQKHGIQILLFVLTPQVPCSMSILLRVYLELKWMYQVATLILD